MDRRDTTRESQLSHHDNDVVVGLHVGLCHEIAGEFHAVERDGCDQTPVTFDRDVERLVTEDALHFEAVPVGRNMRCNFDARVFAADAE